ncbi:MAG: MATE family efflux transporter [Endomicrobium sp.]|jgi:O-antigen/teichoic acid export membrane protein|nr:MATE family efflux transporter [Endomicrobium sp.]
MQKFENILIRFKHLPRHLLVAVSAWIAKIITALISIISVRTLLFYLGEERYAVYVIVYSLVGWFSLCDLGIGSALQNFISECRVKNESYSKYLRAALQVAITLCIVFIILLFFISIFIQKILLNKYFYINEIQTINIIGIIGVILILSVLLNIVYRVYYALQKGYISNVLPAIAMIISMSLIVLFNRYFPIRESILTALLIFTIPQLATSAIPFVKIFKSEVKNIFNFDFSVIKELMTRAFKFSGLAITATLTMGIDYIIMSKTSDAAGITEYNILNKFFMLFIFVHSAVLIAACPVFSELNIKLQFSVIKNMLTKYISFGFIIILSGTFLFYVFSYDAIGILAPNANIKPTVTIFILFAILYISRIWSDTFAVFLQSVNVLKIFWICTPVQAFISIAAQYFLSIKYGINGILLGLIISFLLTSCWILPYKAHKFIKKRIANAI